MLIISFMVIQTYFSREFYDMPMVLVCNLWKNVLKARYRFDDLGWLSKKSSYGHGVGCWKPVFAHLECLKSLVHFNVKNGSRCCFGMMSSVGLTS